MPIVYRKLDRLGSTLRSDYRVVGWQHLLHFIKWYLEYNVIFRCGTQLWKQVKGVPIGGPMSAQLASLWCMACELHRSNLIVSERFLFGTFVRFRDNILLFKHRETSNSEILLFF